MNTQQELTQKIQQLEKEEKAFREELEGFNNKLETLNKERNFTALALNGVMNQLDYYKNKLGNTQVLKSKINAIEEDAKAIASFITDSLEGISSKKSLTSNVDYVINNVIKNVVSNNDVVKILLPYYSDIYTDVSALAPKVSTCLWQLGKRGRIKSYHLSGSRVGYLWGRKDWFDANGNLHPEYQIKKEQEKTPRL